MTIFFLAIVNLQYLTILIKSAVQDVNLQFQYRSLNCEIKRSQICLLLFYSVETSLHSNQRPCMLITDISYHESTIQIQPTPTEKQFQSRFKLNFYIGEPILFYCTFYKVMTHAVLDTVVLDC